MFRFVVLLNLLVPVNASFDVASSYEKNGKKCFYCSTGYYWIDDCLQTNSQARCSPCPPNTFQKNQNIALYCQTCTRCDEIVRNHWEALVLKQCTPHSNTVCGCKATHHFKQDPGGMGRGHCHVNTVCPVGFGLHEYATNFEDNKCLECHSGISFKSSVSLDRCLPCTTKCPNDTHLLYPCNTTHDLECQSNKKDEDKSFPSYTVTQNTQRNPQYLYIGLGCTFAVVFGIIIIVCFLKCRRNTESNAQQNMVTFNRQALQVVVVPKWMLQCKTDITVNWQKLFGICYDHISPDWESFVRTLFDLSDNSEKGQPVIDEAKEAIDREKPKSRLYHALDSWKKRSYKDEDCEMFNIFARAINVHNGSKRKNR